MADVQPSDHLSSDAPSAPEADVLTTSLNRPWLVKMVIFIVVLIAFGFWGLYDAMVAYPARGDAHAEYAQWQFLKAAKLAGKIGAAAEVTDPSGRYNELAAKLPRSDLEQAEYDWLLAQSRMGRLKPEYTKIDSPNAKLDELTAKWNGMQQPKPLEAYDLPLQWSFVAIGFGLGAFVIVNVLRSASKKYTWEPATNTLTLPDGRRVTPDDLADVDKRKWHKFFCALVFTDGSAPVELDVLKYGGLEEWVLTLERVRFPDRAAVEEEPATEDSASEGGEGADEEAEKPADA